MRPAQAGAAVRGDQHRSHRAEPHHADFRLTVMATELLPTLAFSDPHRDPDWGGQGRIPVDRNASIGLPVKSGWTTTDVRGPP